MVQKLSPVTNKFLYKSGGTCHGQAPCLALSPLMTPMIDTCLLPQDPAIRVFIQVSILPYYPAYKPPPHAKAHGPILKLEAHGPIREYSFAAILGGLMREYTSARKILADKLLF